MSPNEISSCFDKILILSSSESSDSESLLEEDIKRRGHHINEQWEAIERTLYQEPGQQVTDPEILKECELWRETFPHFRVKGAKLGVNRLCNEVDETEKRIQTVKNHFDFKKLEKKRECIKKKVVGELVERLIAKYGFEKEGNSEALKNFRGSVQITEIDESYFETSSNPSSNNNIVKNNSSAFSAVSPEKESYFERGKQQNREIFRENEGMTLEQMEKNLYEIFSTWEKECETGQYTKTCDSKKVSDSMRRNFKFRSSHPPTAVCYRPKKFIPPSNSLSNVEKPYEIAKKIDKKYEGLVEKIMERKFNELDSMRHCRSSASNLEIKSYQKSIEKLRSESGFDDYLKRKDMSKLNNFSNNWLKSNGLNSRTEINSFSKKTQNTKLKSKKSLNLSKENKIEKNFFDPRTELALTYKNSGNKNGIDEKISLQKPRSFALVMEKSFKSSSCGNLPKNNKKELKARQSGLEIGKSESNLKNRVQCNKLNNNKGIKSSGNQNPLFPPIESGIICTEIKKMASKNSSKKW